MRIPSIGCLAVCRPIYWFFTWHVIKHFYSSFESSKTPFWHHSCDLPTSLLVWGSDYSQEVHGTFLPKWDGWVLPLWRRSTVLLLPHFTENFPSAPLTLFLFLKLGGLTSLKLTAGVVDQCVSPQGTAKPGEVFTHNSSGWEERPGVLLGGSWSQYL